MFIAFIIDDSVWRVLCGLNSCACTGRVISGLRHCC